MYDLRKNVAVVLQNIKIFNGTILENILVGREVQDLNVVQKRIDAIGIAGFFTRFPQGLLTLIGEEGQKLSAGEMQVLGLVRALFDQPQVLIVDEGISAIDADIENLVFKTLRAYAQHNAVFLISHNLRTLAKTDFLYLLENGAITTGGKPERLLATNTRFQELWHTQQGVAELHVTMP